MAFFPVIGGPIAPYSNLPINAQFYEPSRFVISAITLGITTIVTTTVDDNYVIGQQVRLIIPPAFGSRQLNGQTGFVLSLPTTNSIEISINSVNADVFISNPTFTTPSSQTVAQILAIGDISSGTTNSSGRVSQGTFIPGSFINISP